MARGTWQLQRGLNLLQINLHSSAGSAARLPARDRKGQHEHRLPGQVPEASFQQMHAEQCIKAPLGGSSRSSLSWPYALSAALHQKRLAAFEVVTLDLASACWLHQNHYFLKIDNILMWFEVAQQQVKKSPHCQPKKQVFISYINESMSWCEPPQCCCAGYDPIHRRWSRSAVGEKERWWR